MRWETGRIVRDSAQNIHSGYAKRKDSWYTAGPGLNAHRLAAGDWQGAVDDLDGLRDTGQLQSALRGDFEIVARYGKEHPGAWAGAWWDNEPTVRIVAAFTGDAASHDAALRPRLQHPGRLVLRNSSPERIGPLDCGQPLIGSLLDSSLEVVGGYSGWVAGTGRVIDLAPGETASFPVIFGTASGREGLGYVVPPGRYWLKVQMRLQHGPGAPLTTAPAAPLTPITITPRVQEPGDQAGRHGE